MTARSKHRTPAVAPCAPAPRRCAPSYGLPRPRATHTPPECWTPSRAIRRGRLVTHNLTTRVAGHCIRGALDQRGTASAGHCISGALDQRGLCGGSAAVGPAAQAAARRLLPVAIDRPGAACRWRRLGRLLDASSYRVAGRGCVWSVHARTAAARAARCDWWRAEGGTPWARRRASARVCAGREEGCCCGWCRWRRGGHTRGVGSPRLWARQARARGGQEGCFYWCWGRQARGARALRAAVSSGGGRGRVVGLAGVGVPAAMRGNH